MSPHEEDERNLQKKRDLQKREKETRDTFFDESFYAKIEESRRQTAARLQATPEARNPQYSFTDRVSLPVIPERALQGPEVDGLMTNQPPGPGGSRVHMIEKPSLVGPPGSNQAPARNVHTPQSPKQTLSKGTLATPPHTTPSSYYTAPITYYVPPVAQMGQMAPRYDTPNPVLLRSAERIQQDISQSPMVPGDTMPAPIARMAPCYYITPIPGLLLKSARRFPPGVSRINHPGAIPSVFRDERRRGGPSAPRRAPVPLLPLNTTNETWYAPLWLQQVSATEWDRTAVADLTRVLSRITAAERATSDGNLESSVKYIRSWIHIHEFVEVDAVSVVKSLILDPTTGLPRLFAGRYQFPYDVRADARALAMRWRLRDFRQDMFHGIVPRRCTGADGKTRMTAKVVDNYPHKKPANYFGAGLLANGQWWPSALCVLRDGAHGCTVAGIYGRQGEGAFSILVSASDYEDHDEGETIYYCGTNLPGPEKRMTDRTKYLFDNIKNSNPIRVIRTGGERWRDNPYLPEVGFRYDGLYLAKNAQLLDRVKGLYRFKLERCHGQDPIRYESYERRPTSVQVEEFRRMKASVHR